MSKVKAILDAAAMFGVSPPAVLRSAQRLKTEDYELAAAYAHAACLAIRVKGDRYAWNLAHAEALIETHRGETVGHDPQ